MKNLLLTIVALAFLASSPMATTRIDGDSTSHPGYGTDDMQPSKVAAAQYIVPGFSGQLDSAWAYPYTSAITAASTFRFTMVLYQSYSSGLGRIVTSNDYVDVPPLTAIGNRITLHFSAGTTLTAGTKLVIGLNGTALSGSDNWSYLGQPDTVSMADTVLLYGSDGSTLTSPLVYGLLENSGYGPIKIVLFYTEGGGGTPSAPTLSGPADGAIDQATATTVSWQAYTGATGYGLQVSTSSTLTGGAGTGFVTTTPYNNASIGSGATSQGSLGLSNGTTYYWHMTVTTSGGTSAYSATRSFTTAAATPSAPTLSSPADAATGVSTAPTLSWNSASGATSYTLQVSTSSTLSGGAGTGFATTVYNTSGISSTSQTISLSGNTTYYWHVLATNGNGSSSYSSTRSFTTTASGGTRVMFH